MATFWYVDGRGNGERIRFVLAGAKVEYEEKFITTKQDLQDLVASGKLLTDQVPLLEIDGLNLVQSATIIRYIAKTRGLEPDDMATWVKVDTIYECTKDYETASSLPGYGWQDTEEHKKKITVALEKWFPRFEKIIPTGGFSVSVDKPYYCDFVLLNVLLYTEEVLPGSVEPYPKLNALKNKLCELPQMKEFLASSRRKGLVTEEYKALVKQIFY